MADPATQILQIDSPSFALQPSGRNQSVNASYVTITANSQAFATSNNVASLVESYIIAPDADYDLSVGPTMLDSTFHGHSCVLYNNSVFTLTLHDTSQAGSNIDLGGYLSVQWSPHTFMTMVYSKMTGVWSITSSLLNTMFISKAAHAGGGQASATPLIGPNNLVSACATAGDSVLLLPATGNGKSMRVWNGGLATCDVFPRSGESINGLANNVAIALSPNTGFTVVDYAATKWAIT